jgi:ribosomal protein S18 acetylase RimI-like enzyme
MSDLPENLFANPVWNALRTKHRDFAICNGNACRYPSDVAPFAAIGDLAKAGPAEADPTRVESNKVALQQLHTLLAPGESVWIVGESYPSVPGISFDETLGCLQMSLPEEVMLPDLSLNTAQETSPNKMSAIVRLSDDDAPEMVALTNIAFPGFFRQRTCEMGSYYGVKSNDELIAMAGERLMLDGYPELSGVCTHPAHRGKGLAARLIWELVRDHRRDGLVSWLHVGSENRRAIDLYRRMGFKIVRKVKLNRISRRDKK